MERNLWESCEWLIKVSQFTWQGFKTNTFDERDQFHSNNQKWSQKLNIKNKNNLNNKKLIQRTGDNVINIGILEMIC